MHDWINYKAYKNISLSDEIKNLYVIDRIYKNIIHIIIINNYYYVYIKLLPFYLYLYLSLIWINH